MLQVQSYGSSLTQFAPQSLLFVSEDVNEVTEQEPRGKPLGHAPLKTNLSCPPSVPQQASPFKLATPTSVGVLLQEPSHCVVPPAQPQGWP
jgi:hypothetical protein